MRSDTIFEPGDPFYEPPPSARPGYAVGGTLVGASVGLLAYSFGALPRGRKPPVQHGTRTWVARELVEATGCTSTAPQPLEQRD